MLCNSTNTWRKALGIYFLCSVGFYIFWKLIINMDGLLTSKLQHFTLQIKCPLNVEEVTLNHDDQEKCPEISECYWSLTERLQTEKIHIETCFSYNGYIGLKQQLTFKIKWGLATWRRQFQSHWSKSSSILIGQKCTSNAIQLLYGLVI